MNIKLKRVDGVYIVLPGSEVGKTGATVHIDCVLTLMNSATQMTEVIVLVETDDHSYVAAVYLMPLTQVRPRVEYRLVGIDIDGAAEKLARLASAAFTQGTRISLSTGRQVAVEDLTVGDLILTQDEDA